MSDLRIGFGDAVKALDPARRRVGGYAIRWGSPSDRDLQGEYFTPDTKLWLDGQPVKYAVFDHGLDGELGSERIGKMTAKFDNTGVYVEGDLEAIDWGSDVTAKADRYLAKVYELAEQGKLGWSSGSSPYLARTEPGGKIKTWPIIEFSLTPTPAEFRNRVVPIKSWLDGRATKAGRTVSGVNWSMFDEIERRMRSDLDDIRLFLNQHKPPDWQPPDPGDSSLEQLAQATLLLTT